LTSGPQGPLLFNSACIFFGQEAQITTLSPLDDPTWSDHSSER